MAGSTPFKLLQIRRGNKSDLPTLADGEYGLCEDTGEIFVGTLNGNQLVPIYNAAVPAHWAGSAPATAVSAIDRLAAAVSSLLGTPIP